MVLLQNFVFYFLFIFFLWKIEHKTTFNRPNAVDVAYRTAGTEKYVQCAMVYRLKRRVAVLSNQVVLLAHVVGS
jgi:hypothetical protein